MARRALTPDLAPCRRKLSDALAHKTYCDQLVSRLCCIKQDDASRNYEL